MSDTGRLEAAAAELEKRAAFKAGLLLSDEGHGHPIAVMAAQDRAVAALLREVAPRHRYMLGHGYTLDRDMPADVQAALAVADAVLGVPASPKEQTDA